MTSKKSSLIFIWIIVMISNITAQSQSFKTIDTVYNDVIKTPQLRVKGATFVLPILDLNGNGKLILTFDDMDADDKDYIYTIYHCDRNWNLSDLDEVEYMEGFNGEQIDNRSYSNTAYSSYTNYSLEIPNDDIQWIISGNYILVIEDEEYEEVVLTRRFMIYDRKAIIDASVGKATEYIGSGDQQELYFEVMTQNLNVSDPINDISALAMQNGRWDNAVSNVNPKYTRGQALVFNYNNVFTFPALKEFRHFEFAELDAPGLHVYDNFRFGNDINVLLKKDEPRAHMTYLSKEDFNGNFVIRSPGDETVNSEYCNVIFTLETGREIYETDIYVVGGFADWQLKERYKMTYDVTKKSYVGEAFLKQGYYNYMYAAVTAEGTFIEDIEGNWYEAENDYSIFIYYHPYGARYDELIGVSSFNSLNNWKNR